ncbi:YciI family protein [Labilithrix luteola]|nr:YciI family protein [Labilithrix luteola]
MNAWFLLLYDYVPDYLERRVPLREEHLRLIREAHARGELVMAGAHDDPIDGAFDGGAIVFKTSDRAVVERYAEADPYVKHGLVTRLRIRRWNVVTGGE